jgi:hypothetical protein
LDINASLVDNVTLYAFLAALVISIFINVKDYKNSRLRNNTLDTT